MESLMKEIEQIKNEIRTLKRQIFQKEEDLEKLDKRKVFLMNESEKECSFSKRDIIRYSRQVIIPKIGVSGQRKLKNLSVLIVGVGGLGCPASQYLAGAGVGRLGLIDFDVVEENNLHRQLLHNEDQLGRPKVCSAYVALKKINSQLKVDQYHCILDSGNALEIVGGYDVIVDASDNVATRYLVNDACVLTGRPLVSGSALQLEGQLTVYHWQDGPCYRCLYPQPPPPHTVTNCSDSGVIGPVPGVIGTLQALEVLKIAFQMDGVLSSKLLLLDGENTSFRAIKLRKKDNNCVVCGTNPSITKPIDYEQFCGAAANDQGTYLSLLCDDERISPVQLNKILNSSSPCIIIDVRQASEFEMCSLPSSVNIPLRYLQNNVEQINTLVKDKSNSAAESSVLLCIVCRRGNDSQLGVKALRPLLTGLQIQLYDLEGGLHAWAALVDPEFPAY